MAVLLRLLAVVALTTAMPTYPTQQTLTSPTTDLPANETYEDQMINELDTFTPDTSDDGDAEEDSWRHDKSGPIPVAWVKSLESKFQQLAAIAAVHKDTPEHLKRHAKMVQQMSLYDVHQLKTGKDTTDVIIAATESMSTDELEKKGLWLTGLEIDMMRRTVDSKGKLIFHEQEAFPDKDDLDEDDPSPLDEKKEDDNATNAETSGEVTSSGATSAMIAMTPSGLDRKKRCKEGEHFGMGIDKAACRARCSGWLKLQSNRECKSNDKWLGKFKSLEGCRNKCASTTNCKYFIYGWGSGKGGKGGNCYYEHTSSRNCPQGWEEDKYDFYELSTPTPGCTHTIHFSDNGCQVSTKGCTLVSHTYGADTDEMYGADTDKMYRQVAMKNLGKIEAKVADSYFQAKKWYKQKVIPYCFRSEISSSTRYYFRKAVSQAMKEVNDVGVLCLAMQEMSTCNDDTAMLIVGKWESKKCWAKSRNMADSSSFKASLINLGWCDGSSHVSDMIHEIGHVLGLGHENRRSDRDKYITMNTNELKKLDSDWKAQYTHKENWESDRPYNYASLMHYGQSHPTEPCEYVCKWALVFGLCPHSLGTKNGWKLKCPPDIFWAPRGIKTGRKTGGFDRNDVSQIRDIYKCTPRYKGAAYAKKIASGSCEGSAQGKNYGTFNDVDSCAAKALEDKCSVVMYGGAKYKHWGCRCCKKPTSARSHGVWNLYQVH